MSGRRSSVSVVVVGAGIAGLSTAYHLLQAGFSHVTILEASDRCGGRIKSVIPKEGEGAIELGATCIHGASPDNPVFRLATEWGLDGSLQYLDRLSGQFRGENGENFDKELVQQVWQHFLKMEKNMDDIYTRGQRTDPFPGPKTFKEYAEESRIQLLQQFEEEETRQAACTVFNAILNYCQFMNGEELDRVSADLRGMYKELPGPEKAFTGKGFSSFVNKLLEKLPVDVLHYNIEVTKINWAGKQVEVECKDGKSYKADHVVVTCSLGHLKHNYKNMFEPQLPQSKVGAIERTGFGRVTKLFLYYDQPFWEEGIKLAWSEHGKPITEQSDWIKHVVFFDMAPANPKAIGGTFAGRGAEILESLSDDEVSATCREVLSKFLNVPNIPRPAKILRSSWNSDPLYRGGYSHQSTRNQVKDVDLLAAPLPDDLRPKVLFAGEATHPDHYSTVHGAFLSGVRESERLVKLYSV